MSQSRDDMIQSIVLSVLQEYRQKDSCSACAGRPKTIVPVEISARHVHLTQEAVEKLYGPGHQLTHKRDLSQHGEFLCEERVKIVTAKGEFASVAVLGPVRPAVQIELSLTDCKSLGLKAPVNQSGNLRDAASAVLIGPNGVYCADSAVIAAKAHIHMTKQDAQDYGVVDGQIVRVKLKSPRPITLEDVVVRVKESFQLAMHIDTDEANAAQMPSDGKGEIC